MISKNKDIRRYTDLTISVCNYSLHLLYRNHPSSVVFYFHLLNPRNACLIIVPQMVFRGTPKFRGVKIKSLSIKLR
jgi:hypothetical protein